MENEMKNEKEKEEALYNEMDKLFASVYCLQKRMKWYYPVRIKIGILIATLMTLDHFGVITINVKKD